jgi:hypothetical protein
MANSAGFLSDELRVVKCADDDEVWGWTNKSNSKLQSTTVGNINSWKPHPNVLVPNSHRGVCWALAYRKLLCDTNDQIIKQLAPLEQPIVLT